MTLRKTRNGRWAARSSISPKVASSTGGSAAGIVLAWLLTRIPFLNSAPAPVQAAMVVLLVIGLTFLAGYAKGDPMHTDDQK